MENFDWRKMSKLTYPLGVNEVEYLRFEDNGTWTSSDKGQICVMTNTKPANAVAELNAKMHPINDADCRHMIDSLREWIQHYQAFVTDYGSLPQWKVDVKHSHKSCERMEKEIERLQGLNLS